MTDIDLQPTKNLIIRRLVVKSIIFAVWLAGMLGVYFAKAVELADKTLLYMCFAIVAIWVVSTLRDVRRLKNAEALRAAAIARSDERNILITYKATRLAAVIMLCLVPVAMVVLAFFDMAVAINALAACVGGFVVIYLVCWGILNARG